MPDPTTDITRYADKAMFTSEDTETAALDRPRVYLLSATPDPLGAVAAFSMMYEGRVIRDLAEVTDDERKHYYAECFKTTLKAPLEAIDLHFMVEGLTRASWDQMVRQRTAVFAGESLRFAVKPDLKESVRPGPNVRTREQVRIHNEAVERLNESYQALIAAGVPQEDARGLLPMNVLTRGHWKTNLRNMINELGKRTCTQAQFEWRLIAADLRRALSEYGSKGEVYRPERPAFGSHREVRWQFEHIAASDIFRPICFSNGQCMFKAQMDRGCTIRERVERQAFDEIDDREWALDPQAAWVR